MTPPVPYMPFLRPMAPPRASTLQRFLRFSTASRIRESVVREDRNLAASRRADPAYPPSSMRSDPRPKVSRGSQRVSHPPKERPYPTRTASHHKPTPDTFIPPPVVPLPVHLSAPNLPYFVTRTASKFLPVYQRYRKNGEQRKTMIQGVSGDSRELIKELETELELKSGLTTINPISQHIEIKGLYRRKVQMFLYKRRF